MFTKKICVYSEGRNKGIWQLGIVPYGIVKISIQGGKSNEDRGAAIHSKDVYAKRTGF